jgi:hypothetical protein
MWTIIDSACYTYLVIGLHVTGGLEAIETLVLQLQ